MLFFKNKPEVTLTSEERRIASRIERNQYITKMRAKYDKKNRDYRLVSKEKLDEIRAYADEHIARIRALGDNEDSPNVEHYEQSTNDEIGATNFVISEERRKLADARAQKREALTAARHSEREALTAARHDALKIERIAHSTVLTVHSKMNRYDLYLIDNHNKGVWNEWKDEVREIKQDFTAENQRISLERDIKLGHTVDPSSTTPQNVPISKSINTDVQEDGPPVINYSFSDLSRITLTNFNQINNGMAFANVVALLGDEGNIGTYEDTIKSRLAKPSDFDGSFDLRFWVASVPPNPNKEQKVKGMINGIVLSVIFRDGVVIDKSQRYLKLNTAH